MENKNILVVEDDKIMSSVMQRLLESEGYFVDVAHDSYEALAKVEIGFDVLLLDIGLPGMDGFEVCKKIREMYSQNELPIIMVTGHTSRMDRIRAIESGANDFLGKPFDLTELSVRVRSMLRMKDAHDALNRNRMELEVIVKKRTESLRKALDDLVETQRSLREAHLETIFRLVTAAEFKDRTTANHIKRMSQYCAMIATEIGLPPSEVELILQASPMHDVGKIGTPEEILLKPAKLTVPEFELMKKHTTIGGTILKRSSSNLLQAGETIALTHHEHWDGNGYPNGLAGEDIPLWGRICAVADVFDALTNKRPYKPAFTVDFAFDLLWKGHGKQFDPNLVEVFTNNREKIELIMKKAEENALRA